jgi:uroporphyrinogen-III decarboxylase
LETIPKRRLSEPGIQNERGKKALLTSKERLTRLFNGQDIDRIPIWLLFPYYPSGSYANIWESPSYEPVLQRIYKYTDTIERRSFSKGFCVNVHPDIQHEHRQFVKNGRRISQGIVRYKGIELRSSVERDEHRSYVESFAKDVRDLEKLLAMPYKQPTPEVGWFLEEQKEFGDGGLMAVDMGCPLNVLHSLCNETDFVLFCYEETQKVAEFLDVIGKRILSVCRYLLERGIGEIYWIGGSEFACPPMLPPEFFDKLVVKYTKPMVDLIHNFGKKTMIHCHGKLGEVLESLAAIGANSHHPIEGPPMGDCTLDQARKALGKDVIIAGNLQLGELWSKTEEEMDDLVKQTMQEGMQGAFILAMTGGPSAPKINERVVKNYLRIIETGMRFGCY